MVDDIASDLRKRGDEHVSGVSSYVTTPGRSRNMAAIRRTDTKPEIALRSALHRRGLRFRKDLRLNLGPVKPRPDIVFTRAKVAVFVDGCFWHCCPEHGKPPSQNTGYWGPKLARNVERDRRYDATLTTHGWQVVRIWEHVPLAEAVAAVEDALTVD
ncbi:very short patch repair endonuclease [Nocardioides euryhalodurans]|uniref:Very short patch repair endonuclease n=1 Tax=Nocardioides euryhalodurans TaxID=2518370 RepID=A0A4V1BE86_9ACTN|nr:very short patch repair endonuclease [Nocardioides euryhalodurans]QBR93752.1 very short patch repair endonuclease [Nocardioides euryhalodurans]